MAFSKYTHTHTHTHWSATVCTVPEGTIPGQCLARMEQAPMSSPCCKNPLTVRCGPWLEDVSDDKLIRTDNYA